MVLSRAETKKFYDKFGTKQDWQSFYEGAAIRELINHSDFGNARSVFEFGCGTGTFANVLLEDHLRKDCRYLGVDLSETMVSLTEKRIRKFGKRAKVNLTDGSIELPFPDNSFDRFVSNYVLEILSDEEIHRAFSEANRILSAGGLVSVISLTCGSGLISRTASNIWERIYKLRPMLVGGCRPIELEQFVKNENWIIRHNAQVSSFGIASEILVAERI